MAAEADSNSQDLNDRVVFGRAVEAVIWGMPLVNYQLIRRQAGLGGGRQPDRVLAGSAGLVQPDADAESGPGTPTVTRCPACG